MRLLPFTGNGRTTALAITHFVFVFSLLTGGCSSAPAPNPHPSSAEAISPGTRSSEPTNWVKSETTNKMDGTKEVMLITDATDKSGGSLVVRFTHKKLDVYVITGDIVDDESASVRIKFDDGTPVKQVWTRSTDYRSVFSPRPLDLLGKLQSSRTFYLEYRPYQRVADTITFKVAGLSAVLPESQMAAENKKSADANAAEAALRARILRNVHDCGEKANESGLRFPGQWCWSDPDDNYYKRESQPFRSQQEALMDALSMARMGLAFKKPEEGIHARPEPNNAGFTSGTIAGGGDVSAPQVLYKVDPEYSEEARAAKRGGTVTLSITVDPEGRASDIHVVKGLGMGLDEKAIEAVRKWKFKPGMNKGAAVSASVSVDVTFR